MLPILGQERSVNREDIAVQNRRLDLGLFGALKGKEEGWKRELRRTGPICASVYIYGMEQEGYGGLCAWNLPVAWIPTDSGERIQWRETNRLKAVPKIIEWLNIVVYLGVFDQFEVYQTQPNTSVTIKPE